jgi:hypothetical protein
MRNFQYVRNLENSSRFRNSLSRTPAPRQVIEGPAIFETTDGRQVHSMGNGLFKVAAIGEILTRD